MNSKLKIRKKKVGIWIVFFSPGCFRLSYPILQDAWWCKGTALLGVSTSDISSEQAENKCLRLSAANLTLLPHLKT